MATRTASSWTFLLSRRTTRVCQFAALRPERVSSRQDIGKSLKHANKHALWISDAKSLADTLLQAIACHPRALGNTVLSGATQERRWVRPKHRIHSDDG
jgi:hypothetical protein